MEENNIGKEMYFMTLFEALYEQYGTNEPILLSEISFEDYSRPWIMKQLQTLCEDGRLCKYEKGVYYIPTETVFGKSILSPRKVIEKNTSMTATGLWVLFRGYFSEPIKNYDTDA